MRRNHITAAGIGDRKKRATSLRRQVVYRSYEWASGDYLQGYGDASPTTTRS